MKDTLFRFFAGKGARMERFLNLSSYKKGILLALLGMAILFLIVYGIVYSRVGFLYMGEILVPREENGNTVYSAEIGGAECTFTVTPDNTVLFRWGGRAYGPFTAKRDPSATPKDHPQRANMTGFEIREGEEIFFRGAAYPVTEGYYRLVNEDGSALGPELIVTSSNGGIIYDSDGNIVDPLKPGVSTILHLMEGPELTRKGFWPVWFLCVFFSALGAVGILFEEEIFQWWLSFRIQNPERAEPTELVLFGRNIGLAILVIMLFVLYMKGLQ